ncbi:MAG: glycosyltransferase family 2 protein [Actinomycetales bacterium]
MDTSSTGPGVDVVLPCLNERGALPQVLAALPPGYRAILVDNGSTDGSGELAAELGAVVVRENRRGFGAAAHAGLEAATAEYVAFCDCDGSLDPADLPRLLQPILAGRAELVLGARNPHKGAWPPHARLANKVLAWQLSRAGGIRVSDLGPLRIARREALLGLGLKDRRSGYPLEMFLKARAQGWRVLELPVDYAPRIGTSKVTGTALGTLTAILDMSRELRSARALAANGAGTAARTHPGSGPAPNNS